jgi:hypothetical protein
VILELLARSYFIFLLKVLDDIHCPTSDRKQVQTFIFFFQGCCGLSGNEFKGGGRRRRASTLRAKIAGRALDDLGISMAEIARHVGVTTFSIATIGKEVGLCLR